MRPVVIAGILAVFVVLLASPVIAQEEITDSLQSILDGLQAEITALTLASEQGDQQLEDNIVEEIDLVFEVINSDTERHRTDFQQLEERIETLDAREGTTTIALETQLENIANDIDTVTNTLEDLDARLSSLEIMCPDGQTLVEGTCLDIVCPAGYYLSVNECVKDIESVDIKPIDPEPVTDLEACKVESVTEYHDNGNKKSVTWCRSDGSINAQTLYHDNGNMKSHVLHYPVGTAHQQTLYDKDGNEKSWTEYHPDGSITRQTLYEYKYYNNGDIQSKTYREESTYVQILYKYHDNGNMKSRNGYYDGIKLFQTLYHDNGEQKSETWYDYDGVMRQQWLSDKNGNITAIIYYDYDGSKSQQLYEYYDNGEQKSETMYDYDGSMTLQRLNDENGNTISATTYYPDGQIEGQSLYHYNGVIHTGATHTFYYPDGQMKGQDKTDENGNIISNIGYHPNGTTEYYWHYENNQLMYVEYYDPDGTLLKKSYYPDYEVSVDHIPDVLCTVHYNSDGLAVQIVYPASNETQTCPENH